jgi:hypothetical protein
MRKEDELSQEHTCMRTAHSKEMVFVLLSRDAAAPVAIRAWVAERLRLGKNNEDDPQVVEALACATTMEREGRLWTGPFPGLTLEEAEKLYKANIDLGDW